MSLIERMEFVLLLEDNEKLKAAQEIVQNDVYRLDGGSQWVFKQFVNENITDRSSLIDKLAVAKHDGEIIGWAIIIRPSVHSGHYYHAQGFVRESYRLQGIGKKLQNMCGFNWRNHRHDASSTPMFWASFRND